MPLSFDDHGHNRGALRCAQIVVFGGGSFGTAMACALARQRPQLVVTLLLRDPYVCRDINERHINTRYLQVGNRSSD